MTKTFLRFLADVGLYNISLSVFICQATKCNFFVSSLGMTSFIKKKSFILTTRNAFLHAIPKSNETEYVLVH